MVEEDRGSPMHHSMGGVITMTHIHREIAHNITQHIIYCTYPTVVIVITVQ